MSPVLSGGVSTYALSTDPDAVHNGLTYLTVTKNVAQAFVYLPVTGVPTSATLTSATLRLYTKGSWALITPTVTAQAVATTWGGSTLTWNNKPAGTGTTTTVSHASSADADEFAFVVTTQVAAMLAAGTNFGFVISRTDVGTSKSFYSHLDPTNPPTLELAWSLVPDPPTNVQPSGSRVVATNKPTVSFDADDVTAVRVEIDATGGGFGAPQFDSGWVTTSDAELDLSTTAYGGIGNGVAKDARVAYKNSSGVASAWSDIVTFSYRAYATITLTNPSSGGAWIVNTDTPTITATSTGTITSYRMTVSSASDALTPTYSVYGAASTIAAAVPSGVITDSSDQVVTLEVNDNYDRQAVAGFPLAATVTQTFSFQETGGVPGPVETLLVEQVGRSPFNRLVWTRDNQPDSWLIRRDSQIIATINGNDLDRDEDDNWSWIDYTAAGNTVHTYRVVPKVNGQAIAGGPTYDIITTPYGLWVADPYSQSEVELTSQDPGTWAMGETGATYFPLRGSDAIHVTQNLRGYEGSIGGNIFTDNDHTQLRAMRRFPAREYVVATPYLAFNATLSNFAIAPTPAAFQQWAVTVDFLQQGTTVWEGQGDAIDGAITLLARHTYEEGVNNAALTTGTDTGATNTSGAPVYKTTAAIHDSMGWNSPGATGGGTVTYAVPYIGVAQIYFTPRSSTGDGSLCRLGGTGGSGVAHINLRPNGNVSINDTSDVIQSATTGGHEWVIGSHTRAEVAWTWQTGTVTITVRTYTSYESTTPSNQISASFAAANAVTTLQVGNGADKKSTDFDSVGLWSGNSEWPAPYGVDTTASPLWSIPGVPTATTITIASQVAVADTIDLAYSTTADSDGNPTSPSYVGVQPVGGQGLVQHAITGLTGATTYHAKLSPSHGVFVGDPITFRTFPATGTAISMKIGVGSCQRNHNGSVTSLGWSDLITWAPDLFIDLGDFAYPGGGFKTTDDWTEHLNRYSQQIVGIATMRQALATSACAFMADDHEFSPNNGNSNGGTDTGLIRAVSIEAMQRALPMYPLADTRSIQNKRGLYGSYMIGAHIRVIMLDGESLDRSVQADHDSGSKTFLGSEQEAWLRALLIQPAAVNIIFTGKALLGDPSYGAKGDKPPNYATWRTSLATYINTTLTTGGRAIKVYWVGGDRHANAYVSKANNPIMVGHPAAIASGFEHHALSLDDGEELYDSWFGFDPDSNKVVAAQYLRLTVTDNNTNTVTIVTEARQVTDTSGDPSTWTVSAGWGGTTHTDTWTY